MRRLDSLYKKEINRVAPIIPSDQPKQVIKKPLSFNMLYFYRSVRLVMAIWIILLVSIIVYPWANYFIKKKIDAHQQVLGSESQSIPQTKISPMATVSKSVPTFYYKKGDLEIKAPIVNGIGEEDLKKGLGHHPDSVWPNEKGNFVIAGHSFSLDTDNPYSEVFAHLRDIEIGDQVTVSYQNKKYVYKIVKREVVLPKDVSLFGKTENWQLTFYTCDPPKTDWRRLVFQAELIKID